MWSKELTDRLNCNSTTSSELDCVWSASGGFSSFDHKCRTEGRGTTGAVPPPRKSAAYFSTSFFCFSSSLTLALCLCWPFLTVTVSVFAPSLLLSPTSSSTPPLPSALPTYLFFSPFSPPFLWSLLSSEIRTCHSPPDVSRLVLLREGNWRECLSVCVSFTSSHTHI